MEVSWNRGTPSHHPFLIGIFRYKPAIWGIPPLWNPHIRSNASCRRRLLGERPRREVALPRSYLWPVPMSQHATTCHNMPQQLKRPRRNPFEIHRIVRNRMNIKMNIKMYLRLFAEVIFLDRHTWSYLWKKYPVQTDLECRDNDAKNAICFQVTIPWHWGPQCRTAVWSSFTAAILYQGSATQRILHW